MIDRSTAGIMTMLLCRLSVTSLRSSHAFHLNSLRRQSLSSLSLAATTTKISPELATNSTSTELLHPDQFEMVPPTSLSPSAVMEFLKCPQSYLFQYIWGLKQPTTLALAKGSMCHEALEKIFDLPSDDRSLDVLHNLLRASWSQHRLKDVYKDLFDDDQAQRDVQAERVWGQSALQLLDNYYELEDPRKITRPNPLRREVWLRTNLTVDPSLGITSGISHSNSSDPETFHVRGIVDRLDMIKLSSREVGLRIVDYKTGKAPNLKYSSAMNEQIRQESFFQLKVYALLLREKGGGKAQPSEKLEVRQLQLLYLTNESGKAESMVYNMGATKEERDAELQAIHQQLSGVWTSIQDLVAGQDPRAFVGCNRAFCYCHKCRERFVPGTLWDP